ncbi:MAG: NAD-dependent epimerase/dehydratase family protein [Nitrososphaeria archaeon]
MFKVLVTGGAGFIGSHLVDSLVADGLPVVILDNLSNGSLDNIRHNIGKKNFTFVQADLLYKNVLFDVVKGCDVIWHLAANPEVRLSSMIPEVHFNQNIWATYNLLEAIRKDGHVGVLYFTSTSTVYGEASKIPTPEDYSPLEPISVYGASKLACEALISSYAHTYGFKAVIYRLANIVGPRSGHGVVYDFVSKLRNDQKALEILGDGTQTKSYLHVSDCIEAMKRGLEKSSRRVEVYNVGSEDQINVKSIADIVVEEMGLKDVSFYFTGGVDGGRGWMGDVKVMFLDITKIKSTGWRPKLNSESTIRKAVKELVKETESYRS